MLYTSNRNLIDRGDVLVWQAPMPEGKTKEASMVPPASDSVRLSLNEGYTVHKPLLLSDRLLYTKHHSNTLMAFFDQDHGLHRLSFAVLS